ncbi:MAG TPA: carboxypeptidase-like regulatory domain-containing protein [Terriglobales bacterium]|nr:carboxypeptidase-like regulatory domain-containing protein [Terriglobales bacterium]
MQWAKTVSSFLLFLLVLAISASAQNANTGTVFGVITDPSGAVIPSATVTLHDVATGQERTATTNEVGRYNFASVNPGNYSIKATGAGFRATASSVTVEVGKSFTVDLALTVGQASQTVEVTGTGGADLQTLDATVGETLGGNTLLLLPSQQRSVSSLLLLQPASAPLQQGNQGSSVGGQVAGAQSDQNTILLDGSNITNGVSGNSDYYTNFRGGPEGPIPTPAESIQEFRVSTNNPNASFSGSAGSQVLLVTKRGTNTFHGSAYEYFQNSALNANSWDRNFHNQRRPESHDNRYGGSFGGFIPGIPGENKTYFYANYEGRKLSQITQIQKLVPSATLRQGILRFPDAGGNIVSYNLATSTQCGNGTSACDPRGIGISPVVSQIWNKLPQGNDVSMGDGLNTIGFTGAVNLPIKENFGVLRLDHDLAKNWQLMGSYRYFEQDAAVDKQIDIGGLLPGDVSGNPTSAASIPRQPRYFVTGLTGQLKPNITNQFNFSYLRDFWQWNTAGATPQNAGAAAALQIGGESQNSALVPMNVDTNSVRTRRWDGHNYEYRDDVSWLSGNHLFQFGGSAARSAVLFNRNDGQVSSLTQVVYQLTAANGVNIPGNNIPAGLSAAQTANWNNLYAAALGLVDAANILGTRNAQLQPNPLGTPTDNDVRYDDYSLYLNDAWHIKPTLTLNFGLNWSYDTPPYEITGKQSMMVFTQNGNIVTPVEYLGARTQAATQGQVYNPEIGFAPIRSLHRKYPWDPVWTDFAPRVAAAWNPHFGDGFLGRVFGENKTVIRGGYSQLYDRLNGVQKVINGLQGVGFQQTLTCLGPNRAGVCSTGAKSDPSTAFRIGVDGSSVNTPAMTALNTIPLIPGNANIPDANQTRIPQTFQMDPNYAPGRNHEFDLTVQRAISNTTVLEVGYIGHIAHGIYSPLQLDQAPFFMTFGGQSFAQAFDNVATALRAGTPVAAQPFFETILKGSSLCTSSCTAGVASKFSSNIKAYQVFNLWNNIQPSFVTGPATAAANQITNSMFFWASEGHANYNGGFIALHERNWRGLTLDANLTYSHSLDNTAGGIQDVDRTVPNSYNLNYGYGNSAFDRKYVLNILGTYMEPFGKNPGFVNHLIRDWSFSPIFAWYSGLPLKVGVGSSQEFGQASSATASAMALKPDTFGNSVHSGVTGDTATNIATSGNPAKGGTGLNLFANPVAVFQSYAPILLSQATNGNFSGNLRGMARWNLDLDIARKLQWTERVSSTLSLQMFNVFNHVQFNDPSLSLQSPQTFGVLSTQLNQPRVLELGLHIDF